ncbi:MAG TPA: hypothetical protein VHX65_13395 [Pirellulales bacterium]|jgi:hypothetical protein|nr:hypothetical protein [Pirellulales bacterium]
MMNRMNFGHGPEPADWLENAVELKITFWRGKKGVAFSFELSGGAGSLCEDDIDPGATPEEFAALRELIERFERKRQLD